MASDFEFVAKVMDMDHTLNELDEVGFVALLKQILRECHDLNDEKYSAPDLAGLVLIHIQAFLVDGFAVWPEEEGSGFTDWETVDQAAGRDTRAGMERKPEALDNSGVPVPLDGVDNK